MGSGDQLARSPLGGMVQALSNSAFGRWGAGPAARWWQPVAAEATGPLEAREVRKNGKVLVYQGFVQRALPGVLEDAAPHPAAKPDRGDVPAREYPDAEDWPQGEVPSVWAGYTPGSRRREAAGASSAARTAREPLRKLSLKHSPLRRGLAVGRGRGLHTTRSRGIRAVLRRTVVAAAKSGVMVRGESTGVTARVAGRSPTPRQVGSIPAAPATLWSRQDEEGAMKQRQGSGPDRAKALRAGLRLWVPIPKMERPKAQPTWAQRKAAARRAGEQDGQVGGRCPALALRGADRAAGVRSWVMSSPGVRRHACVRTGAPTSPAWTAHGAVCSHSDGGFTWMVARRDDDPIRRRPTGEASTLREAERKAAKAMRVLAESERAPGMRP